MRRGVEKEGRGLQVPNPKKSSKQIKRPSLFLCPPPHKKINLLFPFSFLTLSPSFAPFHGTHSARAKREKKKAKKKRRRILRYRPLPLSPEEGRPLRRGCAFFSDSPFLLTFTTTYFKTSSNFKTIFFKCTFHTLLNKFSKTYFYP